MSEDEENKRGTLGYLGNHWHKPLLFQKYKIKPVMHDRGDPLCGQALYFPYADFSRPSMPSVRMITTSEE